MWSSHDGSVAGVGDGYEPRLPPRVRLTLVVLPCAALWPVLVLHPVLVPVLAGRLLAVFLVAVQAVAFWWLGARPRTAVAVGLVASALLQVCFPPVGPGLTFVLLCTYAWLRPARETLWGLAAAGMLACGPAVAGQRWALAALWAGAALLAWSWGALGRAGGARRHAENRRTILEERARIARELHDVLSHTVSVMVVQAAAADDIFDLDPAKARQALRRTESAGRQALAELRWFMRAVRADADNGSEPQPTLADLDALADTIRHAGLPVVLRQEGSAEVPAGVQLCAFRIVQESLTNTLRHAYAEHAEVLVRVADGEVDVEVRDDGRGGTQDGAGHGILGMRERAGLLGGSLDAGPAPGGGWRVAARLPWKGDE